MAERSLSIGGDGAFWNEVHGVGRFLHFLQVASQLIPGLRRIADRFARLSGRSFSAFRSLFSAHSVRLRFS